MHKILMFINVEVVQSGEWGEGDVVTLQQLNIK